MKTLLIISAIALALTSVIVWISVSSLNKDARQKGTTNKEYTVWTMVSGAIMAFFMILYEIVREVFFPSRYRTRK